MKKRFIDILGIIAVTSVIIFMTFMFGGSGCFDVLDDIISDDDIQGQREQIENYKKLSESRADFSGEYIQGVPADEAGYIPVDGVDYSSGDIRDAFLDFYEFADYDAFQIITDGNAVYDGGNTAPVFTKRDEPQDSNASKPSAYSGGVDISGGAPDMLTVLENPGTWIDLGDAVIEYISEQTDDFDFVGSDLYEELSDPDFWANDFGGYILDYLADDIEQIDSVSLSEIIGDIIADYIDYALDEYIYLDGLASVASETIREKIDGSGNNSSAADWDAPNIPASDFAINYVIAGRQFYRETLSKNQQRAYDIMATAVQRGQFDLYVDFGITSDEADAVLTALKDDHPEFFFILGYAFGPAEKSGLPIEYMGFMLDEDIVKIGIDKALKEIIAKATPVVSAAKKIDSDINKVKYIADYLCEVNAYDINAIGNQGIYSSIVTNKTVCAGYASAFHYYMNFLGIETTRVNSCFHEWNLLMLDGDYYYMDVTWLDPANDNYIWFNFNQTKADNFMDETKSNAHKRDYMAERLPTPNGTKYSYDNWFGSGTAPAESADSNYSTDIDADIHTDVDVDDINIYNPIQDDTDVTDNPYIYTDPDDDDNKAGHAVIINGVDITENLDIIEIGDTLFAEGKSFIESISDADMSDGMRYYNYEYTDDEEYIYGWLSEYEIDRGTYLEDDFVHLLGMDAIIITSWFTDTPIYLLFIDSIDIVVYLGDGAFSYPSLSKISDAPQYIYGDVYIPIEAFLKMSSSHDFQVRY